VRVTDKNELMEYLRRNQERSSELEHERRRAEIRAQSYALVWKGSSEELTATITGWFEAGYLDAYSLEDALHKASIHFVRHDGSAALVFSIPSAEPAQNAPGEINPRRAFILPLLDKRGWSILDWANEAGVSHATTQDYLTGKTKPYPSTKLKLAKALGISTQQLPG
jgi:lambda repressor-like predicted transcriptional regulator